METRGSGIQEDALSPEEQDFFALVAGQPVKELPKDLYIPPEALKVFLEAFEGPLDLLLYLIRKQNLDILNIPIAEITCQYMQYVEVMRIMDFELAAEYLLMAAMLAEIKSRMLLPRKAEAEEEESDPRAELIRRLQTYERFRQAAEELEQLPRLERDNFLVQAKKPPATSAKCYPEVELSDLLKAISGVLKKADMFSHHHIQREALSVRERMANVLEQLQEKKSIPFIQLFRYEEGRQGVVVTFLAILELSRQALLDIGQNAPFEPIYLRVVN